MTYRISPQDENTQVNIIANNEMIKLDITHQISSQDPNTEVNIVANDEMIKLDITHRISPQERDTEVDIIANNEMTKLDNQSQSGVAKRLSISSRRLQQLLLMVGCSKLLLMLMIPALDVAPLIASIAPATFSPEHIPAETSTAAAVSRSAMTNQTKIVFTIADVAIVSHDGGYLPGLRGLRENGIDADRRFMAIVLIEQMSRAYIVTELIETLDLEHGIGAFDRELPARFLITNIDEFDPAALLGDFGLPTPPTPERNDQAGGP